MAKKQKRIPITVAPDGAVLHTDGVVKPKTDWFDYVNYVILFVFAFLCLFPVVNVVLTSFATEEDYFKYSFLVIPEHFCIDAYRFMFQKGIGKSLFNSVLVSGIGVLYNMLMTSLGAYAMTKKDLPFRKPFLTLILITMFFGGGVIPFYIVLEDLGFVDNLLGVVIPFGINTFNMILLRNFFSNVPEEVIESAKIDGAGETRILFGMVIPLSLAGMATIALFYFVERWNDWYWPLLLLTKDELKTLPLRLREFMEKSENQNYADGADGGFSFELSRNYATVVITIIPIFCVYPFVQKYFVKGVMLGSVKS